MAGAGYRLFATGDVLTAAQVNTYLQQQTVMVFADSSARTTALSGVVAEGMVSYLQSDDTVYVYNGSAWVSIANSGDITSVVAGNGLSGGATSGAATLTIDTAVTADLTTAQTLTNKKLSDSTTTIVDVTDATKAVKFDVGGTTAITGTIATNFTTAKTITIPDATDTLVGRATTDTLTNKTLTSPALTTPTISTATTNGDLLYGTGSGALTRLGIGSSAQVLTVASGVPSWATPASGGGMTQILAPTSLGTSNTYTTSSLSGSYNQLVIYLKDFKASNYFGLSVRFNSDSTADAYQSANLVASTSTAAYGEAYRGTFGSMFNNMYASTDDNFAMITIPNYANATTRKVAFGNAAYLADDTNWATQIGSVAWKNTSAITTISFLSFDQNYSAGVWSGGTVEIYGVN